MKSTKKILAWVLSVIMLVSLVPCAAFASDDDVFSISNGYLTYTFNKITGGFAIDTAEGHPQKSFDNNLPLLYKEDEARSNGTSFITVRVDGEDYIFGRNYSYYKKDSELKTPVISEEGRLIEIEWRIEDVTVIKRIALGRDVNTDIIGNAGIAFEIINNGDKAVDVGVRLLLDTALGDSIDAPYIVPDEAIKPIYAETEFVGDAVPGQIRAVDSLSSPRVMSYLITKGWEGGAVPNRMVVGHWANIANTRYDYTPDTYCDFTNYTNLHAEPDSAAAVYWEKAALGAGESFVGESLYGVGNFSVSDKNGYIDLKITTDRVELNAAGDGYENNGEIEVKVEIDNTLDNSGILEGAYLSLSYDEGEYEAIGSTEAYYEKLENEVRTVSFKLKALPQDEITAGEIYASINATMEKNGEYKNIETLAERTVVLPSTKGKLAEIQMNSVSPKIVWTGGTKGITITGEMKEFDVFSANMGWEMYLEHTTSNHRVLIEKKNISFLDKEFKNLSFKTDEKLYVGKYRIVFYFEDNLVAAFGESITAKPLLEVSADEKYRLRSYGIIALVRSTVGNNTDYDFFTFDNEGQYQAFYDGELEKIGELNGKNLEHDFGKDVDATGEHEILLTVRGYIQEMERKDGNVTERYWAADAADSPITINNILAYEGEEPLKIHRENGTYAVEGDGLIKVVDSVNVWRSKWSLKAQKDIVYTLDSDRISGSIPGGSKPMTLSLDGGGTMIQSLGGFLIDLKYGELSSDWWDGGDGRVTYGISFGGSVSIPIVEAKNTTQNQQNNGSGSGTDPGDSSTGTSTDSNRAASSDPSSAILTSDQEDISDAMHGLFGDPSDDGSSGSQSGSSGSGSGSGSSGSESGSSGSGSGSGSSGSESGSSGSGSGSGSGTTGTSGTNSTGTSGTTTTTGSSTTVSKKGQLKRSNTGMTDGQLSADIREVLFGEDAELKDGKVVVNDIGFVGIDTTVKFGIPKDVLGSLVTNAPGLMVSMTINTIDNVYELDAGINIKIIEAQAVLAFKEVNIKGNDKIVPDKIEFYIREGLAIPVGPPATPLYITGLGGGINGLADTIGGNFTSLPPITILLYLKLQAIGVLEGAFNAKINLEGLSLTGAFTIYKAENLLNIEAGLSARWVDPWSINLFGQVSVLEGIIRGGLTVTIADNYFYGYIYAGIFIPDSIPVVGGKELAGIEAAASHKFIGANLKVLGIKLGMIYYWGGDVKFGKNIDLSAPGTMSIDLDSAYELVDEASGIASYYGTNLHGLICEVRPTEVALMADGEYKELVMNIENAAGEDSLLFEIPFSGEGWPVKDDIVLVNPNGVEITMTDDDGEGGGNFLVQNRYEEGTYIYITVTNPDHIENGDWTIKYKTENVTLTGASVDGVDEISSLRSVSSSYDENRLYELDVNWELDGSGDDAASMDIYFTKDKDIVEKIKTSNNTLSGLGDKLLHIEDVDVIKSGSATVEIPDSYESGDYYAVAMYSTAHGANCAISEPFRFDNPNLPKSVAGVKAIYGGNGNLYIKIDDAEEPDYTHYLVEIEAVDGTSLDNNFNQYALGDDMIFIGKEANLIPGKDYVVNVRTLREEKTVPSQSDEGSVTKYYYGAEMITSAPVTMPKLEKPELISVEANVDLTDKYISENSVELTYTFDRPVWMEVDLRGQMNYFDDEFKEVWSFELEDLDDGDYTVDFTAYSKSKDYVTGSDFDNVPNALIGFTVDSSKPVLTLAQISADSLEPSVKTAFGANVVIAESDGSYIIEGLTEVGAALTVDGSGDGVTVNSDGSFSYEGKLAENEPYAELTIKAVDKADNTSELIVTAVNGKYNSYKRIILLADGKEIEKNENGENQLTLGYLESTALSVLGETADGERVEIPNDEIEFSVLYSKNTASLSDGTLTAILPGETAVKAKLITSTVVTAEGKSINAGLEDYVIVLSEENVKDDLKTEIDSAKLALVENADKVDEAIEALETAIAAAEAVYNNPDATDEQVEEAIAAVKAAVEAIEAAQTKAEKAKGELKTEIDSAKTALNNNADKVDEAIEALENAIEAAEAVCNKADATLEEIAKAADNLEAAVTDIELAPTRAEKAKEELKAEIDIAVQALVDNPDKLDEAKTAFQTAIDEAKAVYDDAAATEAEVLQAITDIKTAAEAFDEAQTVTEKSREELGREIEAAKTALAENADKTAEAKAALEAEIAEAEAVYNNAEAAAGEITEAANELGAAVTTLVNSPTQLELDKEALKGAITEAKALLKNNSNKVTTAKTAYQAEIDAAQETLDKENVTSAEILEAIEKLAEATEVFEAADTKKTSSGGSGGTRNYVITAKTAENGAIELSHSVVRKGTSVTVTAVPDEGYELADMLINGKSVGNEAVYTIASVTENIEVEATFAEKSEDEYTNPFTDVTDDDWFYEVVKEAYEKEIMKGTTETEFAPNADVTRAMFVTVLHRMEGEPEAENSSFTDVADGAYYEAAVAWASKHGIVKGISETEFAPSAKITREQMAAILHRYAEYKGYDVSVGEDTNILSYADAESISEYAIASMQWALGAGILQGKGNGILDPQGTATRAEAAAVITRIMK